MNETNLKIINMSDVESKEISWLWSFRVIPEREKLHSY